MITITDAAYDRMSGYLERYDKKMIRLSVSSKGCNGYSYNVAVENVSYDDETSFLERGITFTWDSRTALLMFGTNIDWEDDGLVSGFVFNNPNSTGSCGCGQSFTIESSCS